MNARRYIIALAFALAAFGQEAAIDADKLRKLLDEQRHERLERWRSLDAQHTYQYSIRFFDEPKARGEWRGDPIVAAYALEPPARFSSIDYAWLGQRGEVVGAIAVTDGARLRTRAIRRLEDPGKGVLYHADWLPVTFAGATRDAFVEHVTIWLHYTGDYESWHRRIRNRPSRPCGEYTGMGVTPLLGEKDRRKATD